MLTKPALMARHAVPFVAAAHSPAMVVSIMSEQLDLISTQAKGSVRISTTQKMSWYRTSQRSPLVFRWNVLHALAVRETVILLALPSIVAIETPTKGRGECSRIRE